MSSPLDSQSHINAFFDLVPERHVTSPQNCLLSVRLVESGSGSPVATDTSTSTSTLRWGRELGSPAPRIPSIELNVRELQHRPIPPVRIIFTSIDEPNSSNIQGLRDLFETYSFPTLFLKERVQGVTNSFGTRDTNHDTIDTWFHFLSKNIILTAPASPDQSAEPRLCGQTPDDHIKAGGPSWNKGGFFLKWSKTGGNIVLVVFGKFPLLEKRLHLFIGLQENVEVARCNPFVLYVIILDEINRGMDWGVWELLRVFNYTETEIFSFASSQKTHTITPSSYRIDFSHLHNLKKHVIHTREGCSAMLNTIHAMKKSHDDLFNAARFRDRNANTVPNPVFENTRRDLEYLLGSFKSLENRIKSLETRVENVVTLAFNLVIQRDSTLLQKDSSSMKTIAVMTLIFLPGTAIATIFGTQLISPDFSSPTSRGALKVSQDFWIFWVLVVLVTGSTVGIWYWCLRSDRRRRYLGKKNTAGLIGRRGGHEMT